MRRRLKRKGSFLSSSLVPSQRYTARPRMPEKRYEVAGRILYVKTYLPRSVAFKARREIYPYPYPSQVQKRGRAIRLKLGKPRGKFVPATVAIRMPKQLPVVRGSYVSVRNGILTIHSTKQLERLQDAQEFNRRRYSERKGNVRKGRYGQLDSRGSQHLGIAAHASRSGRSIDQIADAALVARAIGKAS